jgi:hypothetical protein
MSDLELEALIAAVNDQTAMVEAETARAKAQGREPNPGNFYHQPLVDALKKELHDRGIY